MARSANTEERQSKKKRRRIAINVPRSKEPIWARALFRPGLSTLCGMLSQKCLSFASRVQIISFVKEGHHDFGILVTTEAWNVFGYLRYLKARPAGRFKIWQKTIFFSAILSNDYVPSNDFLRRIESISRDDVVVSRSLMASVLSAVIAEYIFKRHQPLSSSSTFQMVIHIRISSISQLPMYSALMQ